MTRIHLLVSLWLGASLVGCGDSDGSDGGEAQRNVTVYDTTGQEFVLDASRRIVSPETARVCDYESGPVMVVIDSHFTFSLGGGGLLQMCVQDPDGSPALELTGSCRPLVCSTAANCNALVPDATCESGMCRCRACVHPAPPPDMVDDDELVAVCLADVPRSADCVSLPWLDRPWIFEAAQSCQDLCAIPPECR